MTARILLVEDELLVALSLREALSEAGFDVDCAYLGSTVIEERPGVEWDAALVDMALPDRSGATVIQHLLHQQPSLPVILTTGLETPETRRFAADHDLTLLPKPFDESTLVDLLRSVLMTEHA
ncbi:response regulator [Steroidobacter flavus]|uniref:Response regulator n=1 Tax=Steroidobacter flavus TaxID=1842136 RepID=A0ABV8SSX9_9GAMM